MKRKYTYTLGIDISKETLDFSLYKEGKLLLHRQVSNNVKGIKAFYKDAKQYKVNWNNVLYCAEHTGIYSYALLDYLDAHQCDVWLERPIAIKRSLGLQRGKNDKVDSQRIALYAYRFQDQARLWEPPRQELQQLKYLMGQRRRLIKTIQRFEAPWTDMKEVVKECRAHKRLHDNETPKILEQLHASLARVEAAIKAQIQKDAQLVKLFHQVTSVPGIGEITAWAMLIATNEFKQIKTAKEFACYAGLAPFQHQSGKSIRGSCRVSHLANKSLKTLLHMGVLSILSKKKGELYAYYERQIAQGKHHLSVMNALKNKVIHRIYACVLENRTYVLAPQQVDF